MIYRSKEGFSLLEIILVVLVLAVVAGLAVPNFSQTYQKFQLQQATDQLAYLMRYAQSRAITKNKIIQLEFKADLLQYWLAEKESDSDSSSNRFSGRYGKTFSIPDDSSLETELSTVQFFSDGQIDKNYIYVCKKQNCYTISTKEQRGYVKIFEGRL